MCMILRILISKKVYGRKHLKAQGIVYSKKADFIRHKSINKCLPLYRIANKVNRFEHEIYLVLSKGGT